MNYVIRAETQYCHGKGCRLCEGFFPDFYHVFGGVVVISEDELEKAYAMIDVCPGECLIITRGNNEL